MSVPAYWQGQHVTPKVTERKWFCSHKKINLNVLWFVRLYVIGHIQISVRPVKIKNDPAEFKIAGSGVMANQIQCLPLSLSVCIYLFIHIYKSLSLYI